MCGGAQDDRHAREVVGNGPFPGSLVHWASEAYATDLYGPHVHKPQRKGQGPCLVVMRMDERRKIEHQIELATRAAAYIRDETIVQRLRNFAEELRQRLVQTVRRPKVRTRAYELWERAGRPPDRDLEFWLEAERQIDEEA